MSDLITLQNQVLYAKMAYLSNKGKPKEEFIYANINEWLKSDKLKMIHLGNRYYENDPDIKERKRFSIGRKGEKIEETRLSNAKLAHPFMRKLTNQKVNYLLSKPFSIQTNNDQFLKVLYKYFDKNFHRMLKNVGKDAIKGGIAWVQPYYNEQGVLCFKRIPNTEVIPFWRDIDHTDLEAAIRIYKVDTYDDKGNKTQVEKVEYMDETGTYYYQKGKTGLEPDPDRAVQSSGHFKIVSKQKAEDGTVQEVEQEAVWERVPLVAFKYNAEETSLIKIIKPLVDDYDVNTSDTSNNIQDVPNSIKVVRNYDGTDKGEFVHDLALYRTVFVSGDGDVDSVETKMDISAIDRHLDRLRKDIYEFGGGVDTQNKDLGDASGVALKFLYADLDMDCSDLGNEFAAALENLIWFIKVDLVNSGKGDFMDEDVDIIFNTDIAINEQETITNAINSLPILSRKTIVANHPWVTDVEAELAAKDKEMEEDLQRAQDFGFGETNPDNQNQDGDEDE